jgi:hypothetical protein
LSVGDVIVFDVGRFVRSPWWMNGCAIVEYVDPYTSNDIFKRIVLIISNGERIYLDWTFIHESLIDGTFRLIPYVE